MIPYLKEKRENAICFIASEYRKKARTKYISQTLLYKILGFFDFESIQETGEPALGFTYKAMKRGPVPIELYDKRRDIKTDCFVFMPVQDDKDDLDFSEKYIIAARGTPNLDYFNEWEVMKLKQLVEIYAHPSVRTKDASDASHEKIMAWRNTWNREPNSIINYHDPEIVFGKGILDKRSEELTTAEEHYLASLALGGF
jgi:hypothetical protein